MEGRRGWQLVEGARSCDGQTLAPRALPPILLFWERVFALFTVEGPRLCLPGKTNLQKSNSRL